MASERRSRGPKSQGRGRNGEARPRTTARRGGRSTSGAAWHVGLLHAAVAIPGQTDGDDVVITTDEIAASHLDYLALGHWHSTTQGKAGRTLYAYAGAPEPIALDQDRAGNVLLVTLDAPDGKKRVDVEERQGRQDALRAPRPRCRDGRARSRAWSRAARRPVPIPDLVLDVQLIGVQPGRARPRRRRGRDAARRSVPQGPRPRSSGRAAPGGPAPPPDTVLGAFIRDLEARIAEVEAADDEPSAGELRDALRLGRLLLAGAEVTL